MSKTHPTPYPDLNSALCDLVDSVQKVLDDNFIGAYLQGSFAVGDFDMTSDVDFIMVIEEDLTEDVVGALQDIHRRVHDQYPPWGQHLEGSYFPRDILRNHDRSGEPLWYLDHGSRDFERSDHCNTILVRYTVREEGVTLAGPPPETLVNPIPVATLRGDIMATIHNWGQEILDDPDRFNNRFYQAYIVLNYCRMLRDFYRGVPGSKLAGIEWAKVNLDPAWIGLIDRAWATRPTAMVYQPADQVEYAATLEFVRYIMAESAVYVKRVNGGESLARKAEN